MIHTNPETSQSIPNPVLAIMGSTRAGRLCPAITDWVISLADPSLSCEALDLMDWPLPMHDEPGIPAQGNYTQDHTRAWSRKIAAAPAFLFITPQYNWGYPAPLKNAIDHLYAEWTGKPALIVTYGGHGGDKCAAQLRQVLGGLNMRPVATSPALTLTREIIMGAPFTPAQDLANHADAIRRGFAELAAELASAAG